MMPVHTIVAFIMGYSGDISLIYPRIAGAAGVPGSVIYLQAYLSLGLASGDQHAGRKPMLE